MLEAAFSEQQTPPANFYIGLCEDAAILVGANLAGLTELSGNGYARVAVASDGTDFTSATDGADGWKLTTKDCVFTASGGAWNTAKHAFLGTSADDSGKLIGYMEINGATGWTLADGQHIDVAMVLKQPVPA
jgi:hypothetical protein